MPSGGARARSGPAPDPNALRRERDQGDWTVLPSGDRLQPPPEWPLTGCSDREKDLWWKLWRKPQGYMWSRLGQELEVALYVRNFAMAEIPGAPVNLGTLVRQMADSLGLTTPGLRANRWRIPADDAGQKATPSSPAAQQAAPSARDRFKVLSGGVA
jgi:hypothetical protein